MHSRAGSPFPLVTGISNSSNEVSPSSPVGSAAEESNMARWQAQLSKIIVSPGGNGTPWELKPPNQWDPKLLGEEAETLHVG